MVDISLKKCKKAKLLETFSICPQFTTISAPTNGRVNRASATQAIGMGSTPGRVNPKTIKTGIHSFPA